MENKQRQTNRQLRHKQTHNIRAQKHTYTDTHSQKQEQEKHTSTEATTTENILEKQKQHNNTSKQNLADLKHQNCYNMSKASNNHRVHAKKHDHEKTHETQSCNK